MRNDIFTAQLASRILEDAGIGAIWQLQVAAAEAHRDGCPHAAAAILKIAEAAEENRLRLRAKSFLRL
jgi:hypothetical protein